jgi:membrane protease YdiL (CAAX protease family)
MKAFLIKAAKLYGAFGIAVVAFFVQQALVIFFALENMVPSGLAKTVRMKHGVLTLDGTRTMPIWELPIAGKGMLWGCVAGSVILLLAGYFTAGRTLKDFHFEPFSWRKVLPFVLAYIILGTIVTVLETHFPAFRSEGMTTMLQANIKNPLLTLLAIGLAVPFFEELIFRGWLYKKLELTFTSTISLIVTSLVFTLIHAQYNAYILTTLFALSMILGLMRQKSGSIWPGVIIHCLNNTVATLIAFNQI